MVTTSVIQITFELQLCRCPGLHIPDLEAGQKAQHFKIFYRQTRVYKHWISPVLFCQTKYIWDCFPNFSSCSSLRIHPTEFCDLSSPPRFQYIRSKLMYHTFLLESTARAIYWTVNPFGANSSFVVSSAEQIRVLCIPLSTHITNDANHMSSFIPDFNKPWETSFA